MALHAEIVVAKGTVRHQFLGAATVDPSALVAEEVALGVNLLRQHCQLLELVASRTVLPLRHLRGLVLARQHLQHVLQLLGPEPAEVGHLLPLPETQTEGHRCNLPLLINYCQRVDQLDGIHEVDVDDAAPGLVEMHLFKFFKGEAGGEGPLCHEEHEDGFPTGELVEVGGPQDRRELFPRHLPDDTHHNNSLEISVYILEIVFTKIVFIITISQFEIDHSYWSNTGCSVSLFLNACRITLVALRFFTSPLIYRSFRGLLLFSFSLYDIRRGVTDRWRFLTEMGCPSNCSSRQSRSEPTFSTAAKLRNSLQ
jgi:hypothetical protein